MKTTAIKKTRNGKAPSAKLKKVYSDPDADYFLMTHLPQKIYPFAINYLNRIGYTRVWVSNDYTLRKIEFIEGKFNKKAFYKIPKDIDAPIDDENFEVFKCYCEILYEATKRRSLFYEPLTISRRWDDSQLS
jgi:hypothetical protein